MMVTGMIKESKMISVKENLYEMFVHQIGPFFQDTNIKMMIIKRDTLFKTLRIVAGIVTRLVIKDEHVVINAGIKCVLKAFTTFFIANIVSSTGCCLC